ncbi:unnamed protein product [Linum trigynum]|uniref:DUF4283 domain-containing protein n=1 Tax=Linum trigynum TaxID=586398 RepID=A0AAV2E790_9ROSI
MFQLPLVSSSYPWSIYVVDKRGDGVDKPFPWIPLQRTLMEHVSADQIVHFSMEEIHSDRVRKARVLIGRFFSENSLSLVELRDSVNTHWQGQGRIQVRLATHGLYEFTLPDEAAKLWVLRRNPWVIKDRILQLRAWTPTITKRVFDKLAIAPFRVQMWDIPEYCCTQHFGRKMANATIGHVLEA